MVAEIRDYGDGNEIVLHTDQDELYQELKSDKSLIKEIPYYAGDSNTIVAADLYFPKSEKARLQKIIKRI